MTLSTEPSVADKALDAAFTAVTTEIGRTDNKASLLLAFDGAVLAGLTSLADQDLPRAVQVVGAAAGLGLAAAAVLLLLVVRPHLGRTPAPGSFPHWARLDADAIRASMNADTCGAQVKILSTIAVTKYQRLARAVDTILAALALLLAAAILAAIG